MSATMTEREVGFPWYDRHAAHKGREIYQWTLDVDGNHNPFVPGPYITGTEWVSYEAMRDYYRAAAIRPFLRGRDCAGFVRYARPARKPFESWEEAEAWLLGRAARERPAGDDATWGA
jgi:hypothetical protein